MKSIYCLCCILFLGSLSARAQSSVDLYNHVDSLIVHILNYDYHESGKPKKRSSAKRKNSELKNKSTANNPEPLIILDGFPTKKEELKGLPIHYIANIEVLTAGIPSSSLYGSRARNGAIILTTKED